MNLLRSLNTHTHRYATQVHAHLKSTVLPYEVCEQLENALWPALSANENVSTYMQLL